MRIVLRYRSMLGVANAVASGIGLAPLPAILFEDPVFKTRSTPVLMDYPLRQSMLYLVYVSRKYLPLKLLTFRSFSVERISQTPQPRPLAPAVHPRAPSQAPTPIEAWRGCGLRLNNTDGVCACTTNVYRDETLHESDARCSNCERQIQ